MIQFKKIASLVTSALMIGSTVGIAAAANYPAPFVSGNTANVAIVYGGTDAAASDLVAATGVQSDLSSKLTASVGTSTGEESTVSGGDFVKIEKTNNKFNLGEDFTDFYSTLDDGELSTVLASGTYQNLNFDEFDYDQTITPGSALTLTHFADSEFNEYDPKIGLNLASGAHVLNYTLDFSDAAEGTTTDFDDLETTDITLLGKTFYISQADNTANGVKLTLLDTANEAIVAEGETTTVTVGDQSYDVSATFIDDNEAMFTVNGVTTKKLTEGATQKVAEDTYIGVKDVLYSARDSGISKVTFTLGTGKIVLENGQEVQVNGEDISANEDANGYSHIVTAYLTNSSTDLDSITLEWNLDDDAWIVPGKDLVMPGFNTIKISMGGFVFPKEEMTKVEPDGSDSWKLRTEIKDGDIDLNLLYLNSTGTGIAGLGDSSTKQLLTATGSDPTLTLTNIDNVEWIPATAISGDDGESYLFQITKVDTSTPAKNTTTIKNLADGSTKTLDIGETESWGDVEVTLSAATKNGGTEAATIALSGSGSATAYADRLITKEGLKIQLPVDSVTATGDGIINITHAPPTSFTMNFTEEDEDGNINDGASLTATLSPNSGDPTVSGISLASLSGSDEFETADGSDKYIGYVNSPLATKTMRDTGGDQDDLELTYHGDESYADVFLSEVNAMVSSEGGGTTTVAVPVTDTEAATLSNQNLIVVGGSCVNTMAAELLGSATALCGQGFTDATMVGDGQYLIQTFARTGGKVATLVAGYNAGDTTNAATALKTLTVDTTPGKKYTGTVATAITPVVTTA